MNKSKLFAAALAATMFGGLATQGNAVELAENGLGQVLLGPMYNAQTGFHTDLVVVNTSTINAVKAKVVFRSHRMSEEVLDFILYLTPGDVWRGRVENNGHGGARLVSSDDSMRDATGTSFASISPVSQDFAPTDNHPSDSNDHGHFEIIGAYAVSGAINVPGSATPINVVRGMSKFSLAMIFDSARAAISAAAGGTISSVTPSMIQLRGTTDVAQASGNRMSYRMPALASDAATAIAGSQVISNTTFDVTVATETGIGQGFGAFGTDNLPAIETAMATNNFHGSYESDSSNGTLLHVNFPTKYRHWGVDLCGTGGTTVDAAGTKYFLGPFKNTPVGEVTYSVTSYDNQENGAQASTTVFSGFSAAPAASLVEETQTLSPNFYADSGWYNLSLTAANASCGYAGVPSLGQSWRYTIDAAGATDNDDMEAMSHN